MSTSRFIDQLQSTLPFDELELVNEETLIKVKRTRLCAVIQFLKQHTLTQMDVLTSIAGTDYPKRAARFEVAYELLSLRFNVRFRVKCAVDEITPVESITAIFSCADWWEREIWDLLGVFFVRRDEVRRILTDYGFKGHPLRKDFPLCGFVESRYCESRKRVISEPLSFTQEFRVFEFKANNWSPK